MANPFINNKNKFQDILGYIPSDVFLEIAWEQLVIYLGYSPLLESNRKEKGEVGDSNAVYPTPKPVISVEELKINGSIINEFEIYKNSIEFKYPKNISHKEFSFEPYELNQYRLNFTAGYVESELPISFYLAGALLTEIYTADKELTSYSIDTISESYAANSQVNKLINILGPLK